DTPVGGRPGRYPGIAFNAQYSEGVFVGYRHYDQNAIEPLFPFGHGLSYTTFALEDLAVAPAAGGGATVAVTVRNTGSRTGTEVVQVYAGLPEPSASVAQPPKALKAFRKVALAPGDFDRVELALDERAFSYWDAVNDRWTVAPGCYDILVGRSSRDVPLGAKLPLAGATCSE
ncbi:MAG: fibronectin type III-like domain-contianing protein, partial [Candidatus Binatia bacterium]